MKRILSICLAILMMVVTTVSFTACSVNPSTASSADVAGTEIDGSASIPKYIFMFIGEIGRAHV